MSIANQAPVLRPEIKRQLDEAVEQLKQLPETLSDALPEVIYVTDAGDEYDQEPDEDTMLIASRRQEDLVGAGGRKMVGVYVLLAVQDVERVSRLKVHATDLAAPDRPVVDLELGDGGLTVGGEEVVDD